MGIRARLLAMTYDRRMSSIERAGLTHIRSRLLANAYGDVLELGTGTGGNLPHYSAAVHTLNLTEPDPTMTKRLQHAVTAATSLPATTILCAAADHLPVPDASYDTVVSTLVLCGVPDQQAALREIKRVLRPGGQLLLIEHVRSAHPDTAKQQDRYNRLNRWFTGCNCNRATLASLQEAGFIITGIAEGTLPGAPELVRPMIVGHAIRPARRGLDTI